MDNLELWKKVSQAPDWALKPIEAGRLKGKTDINPTWRNMCMTEQFGICGIGWKYTIDKTWTNELASGEIVCFAQVSVYIKVKDTWSDAITSIGGDMLIEKNKNGLQANDECYKMAITDALGKSYAMLGVAANTYAGTKYNRDKTGQQQTSQPAPAFPKLAALKRELDIGIKAGYQTAIEGWLNQEQLDLAVVTEAEAEKALQRLISVRGTFKKDIKNG